MKNLQSFIRRYQKRATLWLILIVLGWLWLDPYVRAFTSRVIVPTAMQVSLVAMQYVFYASICFNYTLFVTAWIIYGRTTTTVPKLRLADFRGHPKIIKQARIWMQDMTNGLPRCILVAGPINAGRKHLTTCIAGELGVPWYYFDAAETMLLGTGALPKILWLFWKVRRMSRRGGAVLVIENVDRMSAVPSLFGIQMVTPLYRRLIIEIRKLSRTKSRTYGLRSAAYRLFGREAPAETRVLVFGLTQFPQYVLYELLNIEQFEETVMLGPPEPANRRDLIEYILTTIPHVSYIDIDKLVRWTANQFTGEIHALLTRDALRHAMRNGRGHICTADVKTAYYELRFGGQMSLPFRESERENVAYHEAGHAVVIAKVLRDYLVDGVSIIARTGFRRWMPYFGVTWSRTDIAEVAPSHDQLKRHIMAAYGGRAAEIVKFGAATLGTGGDTRAIQHMAYMLYNTGFACFFVRKAPRAAFGMGQPPRIQEKAEAVLEATLEELYIETEAILKEHWDVVEELALALLEREELDFDETQEILRRMKNDTLIADNPDSG